MLKKSARHKRDAEGGGVEGRSVRGGGKIVVKSRARRVTLYETLPQWREIIA